MFFASDQYSQNTHLFVKISHLLLPVQKLYRLLKDKHFEKSPASSVERLSVICSRKNNPHSPHTFLTEGVYAFISYFCNYCHKSGRKSFKIIEKCSLFPSGKRDYQSFPVLKESTFNQTKNQTLKLEFGLVKDTLAKIKFTNFTFPKILSKIQNSLYFSYYRYRILF